MKNDDRCNVHTASRFARNANRPFYIIYTRNEAAEVRRTPFDDDREMDRPHLATNFSRKGARNEKLLLFLQEKLETGFVISQSLRLLSQKYVRNAHRTRRVDFILECYKSNSYLRANLNVDIATRTRHHPATIGPSLGSHFHEK